MAQNALEASPVSSPTVLSLDLSYACNLACTTCRCPTIDADTGHPRLSRELALRAVEEFGRAGGATVSIVGGEPLLVPYVYEVLATATSLGLRTLIITNGVAATERNAARLIDAGLSMATVSMDGDPIGHERIRGEGTFEKAVQGARNIASAAAERGRDDFKIDFHVTVSRANAGCLSGLIPRIADVGANLSVSVTCATRVPDDVMVATVLEVGRPADTVRNHWCLPSDILLTEDQLGSLRDELAEMHRLADQHGIRLRVDPALERPDAEPNLVRGVFMLDSPCRVFETKLLVGPGGAVGSCSMMTHVSFGSLEGRTLASVWGPDGLFEPLRERLRHGYFPVCQHCCVHDQLMSSSPQ
jgi:MoaA/NifB/PqqE/SkfB family radical SAM enzyme